MSKTKKSDRVNDTIKGLAKALHKVGAIDKKTMRHFDKSLLTPVRQVTPKQIRGLREREGVSQSVLADYLNVSTDFISKCERGERQLTGSTLKLLTLAEHKGLDAIA